MGLLDFFLSDDKKIARHTRRLTNRDSQAEDREASARWLAENGTDQAILGLLARFDMVLDHQLKDAQERDFVYGLLAELGEKAVPATRSWLRQCKRIALPLRLLRDIAGREAAVDAAFEVLALERARDDFKPDKKRELLVWLTDVRDPRCVDDVIPFLQDFDEGVRYAAAEVLYAQDDPRAREPLLAVLTDPKEESNRLRVRVAEIFVARRWSVSDAEELPTNLPSGFQVRDGRLAAAR